MIYGHYITNTMGDEHFFVEGCSYCRMSTGGQHEVNCPVKDIKVADKVRCLKYDWNFRRSNDTC